VAKAFAKRRGLGVSQALVRASSAVQFGKSAREREAQSKVAFAVKGSLAPDTNYLLLDDIITTGSTVKYAAKHLAQAGAGQVWVAVVARQSLN